MPQQTWKATLGVLGLAFGIVTALHADPTSDARKAIQAQYDRSNAAVSKKDVKGVTAIYTSDYSQVDTKGKAHELEGTKAMMKQVLSMVSSMNLTTTVQTIKVTGNTAVVHVKEHGVATMANPQTKAVSKMVMDSVDEDVWVKSGTTWLQKHSKEISQTSSVDGKPLP